MLRAFKPQVCFQEVPNETSLSFVCTGCPLRCRGCHSTHSWSEDAGEPLSEVRFESYLSQYHGMVTCVLFFGGEWRSSSLCSLLKLARAHGLKTCLYSGLEEVSNNIRQHLTYLKTGPWRSELGGLSSPVTNQRFIEVASGRSLNHLFVEEKHACT